MVYPHFDFAVAECEGFALSDDDIEVPRRGPLGEPRRKAALRPIEKLAANRVLVDLSRKAVIEPA